MQNRRLADLGEEAEREKFTLFNRLLTRYPWGCSALLIPAGVFMVVAAFFVPTTDDTFFTLGLASIFFGVVGLLIGLGAIIIRRVRRAVTPLPDPALAILRIADGSGFVRYTYEEGKAAMVELLVERLSIPREEACERIDTLEKQGQLEYTPSGRWAIGE